MGFSRCVARHRPWPPPGDATGGSIADFVRMSIGRSVSCLGSAKMSPPNRSAKMSPHDHGDIDHARPTDVGRSQPPGARPAQGPGSRPVAGLQRAPRAPRGRTAAFFSPSRRCACFTCYTLVLRVYGHATCPVRRLRHAPHTSATSVTSVTSSQDTAKREPRPPASPPCSRPGRLPCAIAPPLSPQHSARRANRPRSSPPPITPGAASAMAKLHALCYNPDRQPEDRAVLESTPSADWWLHGTRSPEYHARASPPFPPCR